MRRFVAPVVLLLALPALALGQESAAPLVHGAEVRISAKKWDEALQFIQEEALPAFPENAELWYYLGVVYAQGTKRDTEEAAKAFAKAHELVDPENTELKEKIDKAVQAMYAPLVNAAAKEIEAGNLEKAQGLLEKAVELNPEGSEAWINLGALYLKQKKNAEAVHALEKALELKPDELTLKYNLGVTYHQVGREARAAGDSAKWAEYLGKAEQQYREYLKVKPGDPDVTNNLAALYQERGDDVQMRQALKGAVAADSADVGTLLDAGDAFLRAKDYTQAEQAYAKVIAASDSTEPHALENMGLVLIQLKRADQAITVLQKLIRLQPENATAYNYLGYALRDAGRKDDALAAFSKYEELSKAQGKAPAGEAPKEEAEEEEEVSSP